MTTPYLGKQIMLAGACILIAATPAIAADNSNISPATQQKYDNRLTEMQKLDVNKDGILQTSELQQGVLEKFDAADTNKDGFISDEERAAIVDSVQDMGNEQVGEKLGERRAANVDRRYNVTDTNEDGKVSKEEYEAYFGNHYQAYDRNRDGIIDEKEYRSDYETHKNRRD